MIMNVTISLAKNHIRDGAEPSVIRADLIKVIRLFEEQEKKKQLPVEDETPSTLNEECTAYGCNEPAVGDYNGHGAFGCKYHLRKWEKHFEDNYR